MDVSAFLPCTFCRSCMHHCWMKTSDRITKLASRLYQFSLPKSYNLGVYPTIYRVLNTVTKTSALFIRLYNFEINVLYYKSYKNWLYILLRPDHYSSKSLLVFSLQIMTFTGKTTPQMPFGWHFKFKEIHWRYFSPISHYWDLLRLFYSLLLLSLQPSFPLFFLSLFISVTFITQYNFFPGWNVSLMSLI